MRYPEEHKRAVHERIVRAAARALRRAGVDGIGIPALMKQVGLTHGGFYAHFPNRDALVVEAVRAAGEETAASVFQPASSLTEALTRYLSPEHVRHPEHGCVVAALAAESPRQTKPVRRAFAEVTRGLLRLIQEKVCATAPQPVEQSLSDGALLVGATAVGAVVLARAVEDPELAQRILRVALESARAIPSGNAAAPRTRAKPQRQRLRS